MTSQANTAPLKGLLCIWTDIGLEFEEDFNRWYDREHMGERMALPGFELARRFVAQDGGPRYLALYRTSSLAMFRSDAYRDAFANQTEWSKRNFGRMQNTVRRVGEIASGAGDGEGGALSLYMTSSVDAVPSNSALEEATRSNHVLAAYVVRSDAGLSVPLTGQQTRPVSDALVIVEGTTIDATAPRARQLANAHGNANARVTSFRHLWSLRDLARQQDNPRS